MKKKIFYYLVLPVIIVAGTASAVALANTLPFGTAELYIQVMGEGWIGQPGVASNVNSKAFAIDDSILATTTPKLKEGLDKALEKSTYDPEFDNVHKVQLSQSELNSIMNALGSANMRSDSLQTAKDYGAGGEVVLDRSSLILKYNNNYYLVIINKISPL